MLKTVVKLCFLFFREYRLRFSHFFKYGVIMVLIAAYFSVLVSLPLVSEFAEIRPFEVAEFDVFLSGPLEKPDIERVRGGAEAIVEGACFGDTEVYVKGNFAGRINLILVNDLQRALEITEINERYIRRGKVSRRGAVIDAYTAKKLSVDVGNQVRIKIKKDVAVEYRIVAVLFPTSVTSGIILADYPQEVKEAFRPFEYTSFWVKWKNGVENGVKGEGNYTLLKRSDLIRQQKEALDELTHNRMLRLLKWGGIVALFLIALKDIWLLFETRKKDYALLLGLGFSRKSLGTHFLAENLLRMAVTVFVGTLCAKLYMQRIIGFYYPSEAFMESLMYLLLVAITASCLGSAVASKRLRRISIAEVLAEG